MTTTRRYTSSHGRTPRCFYCERVEDPNAAIIIKITGKVCCPECYADLFTTTSKGTS